MPISRSMDPFGGLGLESSFQVFAGRGWEEGMVLCFYILVNKLRTAFHPQRSFSVNFWMIVCNWTDIVSILIRLAQMFPPQVE